MTAAAAPVIETPRLRLRELGPADITEQYLAWLQEEDARRYVTAAAGTRSLQDLRDYVAERAGRDDVLFLGIFDAQTGVHIGNVKYEPVDSARGFAVMGILIGNPAYRGRGVAAEAVTASGVWLRDHRGIRQIALGVSRHNPGAIRAYEKAGFVLEETPLIEKWHPDQVTMVWRL